MTSDTFDFVWWNIHCDLLVLVGGGPGTFVCRGTLADGT